MKFCFIDFEYNGTSENPLNLVCCTLEYEGKIVEHWLHKNGESKHTLMCDLDVMNQDGYIFVAWQAVSEARSFFSLGLMPMGFKWIDLFIEYRCLTNHNDDLMFGKQLVNGKVKKTRRPPPKWERTEQDTKMSFRPTHSLAEGTYKLLGEIRDTEHKKVMRDLIISTPDGFTLEQKNDIQKYCTEDVVYMEDIMDQVFYHYKKLLGSDYNEEHLVEEMLYRGSYAALTSIREAKGYPIDYEKTKNFSDQVPMIIEECQRDINKQFPELNLFKYNLRTQKFSWNQKGTREWLQDNVDTSAWIKTEKKSLSLAKDAFERYFPYRHEYPRHNLGAQILRYLKLKQSLNGFVPSKKSNFWNYVGKDGLVRPYMNIYGSQTSRSQPKATGFIPLKPAWTRSLIYPPEGWAITGLDYGSEEFFISALMSEDQNMIDSYLSGDVYLAFAKLAGMVPADGTKADYKEERNLCKATVLGMSYDMTCHGLARKLTADTGRTWTPEEAQELIDLFEETYDRFMSFKKDIQDTYEIDGRLQLADGWYLWGDNDNKRSVGNFPIQGMGAVIMRKADLLCHEAGLYVPFTLHDALYILHKSDDYAAIDTAIDAMREGFAYFFDGDYKDLSRKIRIDAETWGPDYTDGQKITTPEGRVLKCENVHIDERAMSEYEKFSKYFEKEDEDIF